MSMGDKLFNINQIGEMIKSSNSVLFSSDLSISKIQKGKVNHIYRIIDNISKKSLIFKQAGTVAAGLKSNAFNNVSLSLKRNHKEVEALKFINTINPDYAPKVILSNEAYAYYVMEDFKGYEDVRDLILEHTVPPNFSSKITDILLAIYEQSNDFIKLNNKISRSEKLQNFLFRLPYRLSESIIKVYSKTKRFTKSKSNGHNMKDVMYVLLFKIPFSKKNILNNKHLNDNQYYMELLCNQKVYKELQQLSSVMFNTKQTVLNGDLHLGSICCKDQDYKIYDFEFTFIGPIGYDVGKVLAHLILGWFYQSFFKIGNRTEILLKEISLFFDLFCEKYKQISKEEKVPVELVKQHIMKFCGVELISRVTGQLRMKYLTDITDEKSRNLAQKFIVDFAVQYIMKSESFHSGSEITGQFKDFKYV